MKMLGHKRVENSMKYINIYMLTFRKETEYDVVTATSPDEIKAALSAGFDWVCDKFGMTFFRRVKRISFAGTPVSSRETQSPTNIQSLPMETSNHKRKSDIISLK
jgi:hypothetical protein